MWDFMLRFKEKVAQQYECCLSVSPSVCPYLTHIFLEANMSHIKSDSSAVR